MSCTEGREKTENGMKQPLLCAYLPWIISVLTCGHRQDVMVSWVMHYFQPVMFFVDYHKKAEKLWNINLIGSMKFVQFWGESMVAGKACF